MKKSNVSQYSAQALHCWRCSVYKHSLLLITFHPTMRQTHMMTCPFIITDMFSAVRPIMMMVSMLKRAISVIGDMTF